MSTDLVPEGETPLSDESESRSDENSVTTDLQSNLMGPLLGWILLAVSVALLVFMAYFLLVVVGSLTEPSPFFQRMTDSYFPVRESTEGRPDELTVNLAIILEYANADIRTTSVQLAFSLIAGLFFTLVGVLLLAAGLSGSLDFVGNFQGATFRLMTAAPGLVAILIGGIIIIIGVSKDVSRPLNASVQRAMGMSLSTDSVEPPATISGEPPATDQTEPD